MNKCVAFFCNKNHKLPFSFSTLTSKKPLELLYSDVWGPSPIVSKEGYKYDVSFIDHKTIYIWYYPMRLKSEVSNIFIQFKILAENLFQTSIQSIYTDGGRV